MNAELCDFDFGYITFGNNIISPNFRLIITKAEFDKANGSVPNSFIPFKDDLQKTGAVQISDLDYQT
jgi:hypothetical protein